MLIRTYGWHHLLFRGSLHFWISQAYWCSSIYLLIGATFYFSRITKRDIDIKHNSDPSARDTTFNEFLANCDARFLTELTDYRAKFNTELTSRDENFIAEIQRILTMLNTSTVRLDEIEQVLQNHHTILVGSQPNSNQSIDLLQFSKPKLINDTLLSRVLIGEDQTSKARLRHLLLVHQIPQTQAKNSRISFL